MRENIQHRLNFVQSFCPTNQFCCMASLLLRLRKHRVASARHLLSQCIPVLTALNAISKSHVMSATIETREGYVPQKPETLAAYLSGVDAVRRILGGEPGHWSIAEVGDGNLNLVFIVKGPRGGVAVKQALPYVRLVGESWPLPLSRAHYEHMALTEQARLTGALVPKIHHYDERQALIVMELLEPHVIMRRGMIAATIYPSFADDISSFMARTLYFTSDLALTADAKKALIAAFAGNTALCKITEDLTQSLDLAAARCLCCALARGRRPESGGVAPQAQVPVVGGGHAAWRPAYRLHHADAAGYPHHRP